MNTSWEEDIEEYERKNRENLQRMVDDKRLNVIRGRKPDRLSVRSRDNKQIGEPRKKVSSTKLRDAILRFHKQTSTNAKPKEVGMRNISSSAIRDMVSHMLFPRNRSISHGFHNRFLHITVTLLSHAYALVHGCDPEMIGFVRNLRQILNWFVDNKFTYMIPYSETRTYPPASMGESGSSKNDTSRRIEPEKSIKDTLKGIKYKRMDMRTILPSPTHTITKFRNIGKFLLLVQVKSIGSNEVKTVLLMRNEMNISIQLDDYLVLPNSSTFKSTINGIQLPVFVTFHYIKRESYDVTI